LQERGFVADARVLNAWEYGVPQHRARLFVVATRGFEFAWPRRRSLVNLRDAIGDLPPIPAGQREDRLPYRASPTTTFQRRARALLHGRNAEIVFDHCSRAVRADDAEAFALLRPGGTYAELPQHLRRYRSDIFDDKYKRLAWDELSRTITAHIAKDGYWYIHPDQIRTLSIREAARIQTFPDHFRFAGHPSAQYRQIGNAVPPALAKAVGQRLLVALKQPRRRRRPEAVPDLRAVGDMLKPHADPWLLSGNPWLVLAGETSLRRVTRATARRALAVLVERAPTPSAAFAHGDLLGQLQSVGVPPVAARSVAALAEAIVKDFSGVVPEDRAALTRLPGIGSNVAAAVRCFGWGHSVVLLDRAAKRVLERLTDRSCSSTWTAQLELLKLAGSSGSERNINLAIRTVASTYCFPREPVCSGCPLRASCRSNRRWRDRNSVRPPITQVA
jgi:DNA (cytosine-5)-methyltransferase 1